MKYILIIMLISFAFGQDMTYSETINDEEFQIGLHTTSGITRTLLEGDVVGAETEIVMPFELEPIKIWHFLDYAEECYNDSTEDSYVRVLDSAEIIYFNHREPTFKGFIEWIGSKQ